MYGNHLRTLSWMGMTLLAALLLCPGVGLAWQLEAVEPIAETGATPSSSLRAAAGQAEERTDAPSAGQADARADVQAAEQAETQPASRPIVRSAESPETPQSDAAGGDASTTTSSAAQTSGRTDIQTASFQGVVPGQATLDDVKQALGEPLSTEVDGRQKQLVYRVGPFPKVELLLTDGVATSIVIHLSRASRPAQVAKELGLSPFRPASIPDDDGRLLAQAFPERGVLFVFSEDPQKPGVTHIVLEPIAAEPFILRVQHDDQRRYRENLADLDYAQRLAPDDARVYVLRAQILGSIGRVDEALQNMSTAVKLDGENIRYRLLGAKLLVVAGENERALVLAEAIARHDEAEDLSRAEAEALWGDILASGANGDYQEASKHHVKAVELAVQIAAGESHAARRAARRVAIDAHLAVARDITMGNWRNKDQTAARWLSQADGIAAAAIQHDDADAMLPLVVLRGKLAAAAGGGGRIDAVAPAKAVVKFVEQKLAGDVDPLYRNQLEWELGLALFDASRAQQARGRTDEAIAYGERAVELFQQAAADREANEMHHYLLGRACFRIGSYYAVGKSDHQTAAEWYQKSLLHFTHPLPVAARLELGLHGERYVSMGASYWKLGQQDAGVKLTEQGIKFIEQAVEGGRARRETLAIPYGNLAAMHRQLGHEDQAEEIANLAQRIESDAPMQR